MAKTVRLGDVAAVFQGMSMSGRGAGAREGEWRARAVSVGDIQDDRLLLERAEQIAIEQSSRTERYLLFPNDLLVTGRSTAFKAALVPPQVAQTVADASLNIVRSETTGLTAYLWLFFTSPTGRGQVQSLMSGTTVQSLPANELAQLEVPLPEPRNLERIARLVDESERAYQAAIEAAVLRRSLVRDTIIDDLRRRTGGKA